VKFNSKKQKIEKTKKQKNKNQFFAFLLYFSSFKKPKSRKAK